MKNKKAIGITLLILAFIGFIGFIAYCAGWDFAFVVLWAFIIFGVMTYGLVLLGS